ncbi:hypothetical protein NIES2135_05090 [Leptolyngbya boryana NIES-2135]|jgi:DNA invertase Pin-like site-specific DNA recombinase|uniref:Insertion element IS150 protein InsJ-like helix-turn-helix domain-containing protein n=1 Tax=Leptolyngbya boryana NIES-2135 TaxID=1973484 RepID=A0A1Z4JAA0_LEPBY|nr:MULTISPECIES: helix-turn-helix domain-containing protein [Leptolyngbya]BAY53699.1 hypothetical protein NIES2135_05090 [Leptolyngbya boryana NIES-2135]MBD1854556.1 helix-turn-helix domain-containing protein [Leptolyngbya sp. FACHB-1624]MBD2367862.1 helix-turn-helix domain-containing protein [Leptolyngbya sp. FACHB-161]MBD2374290.1 helix-turn-helix domain-containing protein [Leptolyngbya sp. FACHB-238]MBD2398512.1 helix-turn-helix domain-containing protein [Leptolyngbya sp. FACHB-239]
MAKRKNITDQQLAVVRALIAGRSYSEIEQELGVPKRTVSRWKAQFSGLLAEHDDAISSTLLEARSESAALVVSALDELGRLLRTAEETQDKLAVVDRIFRAHQILNPPTSPGSVTVTPAEESHGQVVVMLPDNSRGSKS